MAIRFPKNYNRRLLINLKDTEGTDNWKLMAVGISSRSNSINESTEKYYYMDKRGVAETEITGQEVSISMTGHRAVGDVGQDYILDEVLYDLDKREIEFCDYDDGVDTSTTPKPANGYRGIATLQITDFGSGDTANRQNIGFTLNINGKPEKGTMTEANGVYTWQAEA